MLPRGESGQLLMGIRSAVETRVGASPEKGLRLRQVRRDQQEVVHQTQEQPTRGQMRRVLRQGPGRPRNLNIPVHKDKGKGTFCKESRQRPTLLMGRGCSRGRTGGGAAVGPKPVETRSGPGHASCRFYAYTQDPLTTSHVT